MVVLSLLLDMGARSRVLGNNTNSVVLVCMVNVSMLFFMGFYQMYTMIAFVIEKERERERESACLDVTKTYSLCNLSQSLYPCNCSLE